MDLTKKKLRIAMVGLGDIAQKAYLPIIANHLEIVPILFTRNQEKLAKYSRLYRIEETYHNLSDLIAAQPDAVMIHTATDSHFEIAKRLINAGIATFVDKPLSLYFDECELLIEQARLKNVPLFVGFNRRYAPLISPLNKENCTHIRWQKNRVNLPSTPRDIIYNDFIHVIDGLRYLANISTPFDNKALKVTAFYQKNSLANIHFQYNQNDTLIEGSMNRLSGFTEERLELFADNKKIQIDNLTQGKCYQANHAKDLTFNDWQSYLFSRGFVDMIEAWLKVIRAGVSLETQLDEVLNSHQACEQVLQQIKLTH